MQNDFLFELGVEELPSGSVWPMAQALGASLEDSFKKNNLQFGAVNLFATPRRIGLRVSNLDAQIAPQAITKRGPAKDKAYDAEGRPTQALLGFAKSCDASVDALVLQETDKGAYMVYEQKIPAKPTQDLLPELIAQALKTLPIPKLMRWGAGDDEFIRPVHWVVMLWGDMVIPAKFFGIETSNISYGHRFHHPEAVMIVTAKAYEAALEKADVVVDFQQRRELIIQQIQALASNIDAKAIMPEDLIDEVTSIVEWPVALIVPFDEKFLVVPPEALIAAMQDHQKCFALTTHDNKLLPKFITVANIKSREEASVISGNEKVMRARLSDADFFFQQDKKSTLASHIESTKRVIFQVKLGTLFDKTSRMTALLKQSQSYFTSDMDEANRAITLSKCDLMTGMVGEFPELQGIMGYYYGLHDGESEVIASALKEQYMPRFSGDDLPQRALGRALSILDRIDTLVGIFGIGEKPTGVKDPFKLRRHALALVRLILANDKPISLQTLITASAESYGPLVKAAEVSGLKPFILDRLFAYYQSLGVDKAWVQAVLAIENDNLQDVQSRIDALVAFLNTDAMTSLVAAAKRVDNILANIKALPSSIDINLLQVSAEKTLYEHLLTWDKGVAVSDYPLRLQKLAALQAPVDAFFTDVMVMVDDAALKSNRLALLVNLQQAFKQVADISMLQSRDCQGAFT